MSTAVLIVNWNGCADTLECLESVFRLSPRPARVIVCDNGSTDSSVARIRAWAEGSLCTWTPPDHPLRPLTFPPLPKPIPLAEYDRHTAERGGKPRSDSSGLVLIHTGANLGFAGGNNVGLRYALAQPDVQAVWLLNNDTVVPPDALRFLEQRLHAGPDVGMVGSTLRYYSEPHKVQTQGGASYNPWLALPRHIGHARPAETPCPAAQVQRQLAYIAGASMLVSRRFVEQIGGMNEEFFLYFEELDWALRARGRFALAYAPESIVFHREGGSIGSGSRDAAKSWISDYHFLRNRVRITRQWRPAMLPTVYLALGVALLRRARRGQWRDLPKLARVIWEA